MNKKDQGKPDSPVQSAYPEAHLILTDGTIVPVRGVVLKLTNDGSSPKAFLSLSRLLDDHRRLCCTDIALTMVVDTYLRMEEEEALQDAAEKENNEQKR